MKEKKLPIIFILIIIFFLGFNLLNRQTSPIEAPIQNIKHIKIGGVSVSLELALTKESQAQGLSGRTVLPEDTGMLFVFDKPSKYPFWMKDMNFPIDIIWIGEDLRIVYMKKNANPESYPETFIPTQNAKYVLEVISGFSDKNNLKEGDRILFF